MALAEEDGKVIENFGASEGAIKAIDIGGSKGQAIVATADGRVVYAGNRTAWLR